MKYRAILLALMMLSCMCVQADDNELKTTINGVIYETYRKNNDEIKVMATGIEDNYPADVTIQESVTFKVPQKDAEGNEITNEYEEYGPYEVDSLNFSFSGKTKIESVSLPNSIKTLPDNVFQNCINLKTVKLPNGISSVPPNAFTCTAITNIEIPGSVTEIGGSAFQDCQKLETVKIEGIRTIGNNAFRGCAKLCNPTFKQVEIIGDNAFLGCSSIKGKWNIPDCVKIIGSNAFQNCSELTEITIGSGIEEIKGGAFYGCTKIDTIRIYAKQPPGKNEIINKRENKPILMVLDVNLYRETYWAWEEYFNLVQLVEQDKNIYDVNKEGKTASLVGRLPSNNYQPAPSNMRKTAESDESITIPETITVEGDEYTVIAIKSYALCNDSKTTSFTIPATITSIDEAAFQYCENMKSFYCLAPQVPHIEATAFLGTDVSNATLYVPKGAVEIYRNSSPWNGFGSIEGIDATGIRSMNLDAVKSAMWYNLKGQVLKKKPHQKGIYIYKGKKMAIQ